MPRVTLMGFYRWSDEKLFDNIPLPDTVSAPILVRLLLKDYGMLFPWQQDGDELILDINSWFESRLPYYVRLSDAILADYNPIENYRRNEEREVSGNSKVSRIGTENRTGKNTESLEGADSKTSDSNSVLTSKDTSGRKDETTRTLNTDTGITQSTDSTGTSEKDFSESANETKSVAAYNSENFLNREKLDKISSGNENTSQESHVEGKEDRDETVTESINFSSDGNASSDQEGATNAKEIGTLSRTSNLDTQMDGSTTSEQTGESGEKEKLLAYGNVGVTTTQQMIREEIDLRAVMNSLYTIIMKEFEAEFLMRIY